MDGHCHLTIMEYQAGENEEWLECKHCGHTEDLPPITCDEQAAICNQMGDMAAFVAQKEQSK